MSAAEDLMRLVPPPEAKLPSVDWFQIEERLSVRLPDDYKWLVGRYGGGKFDDFLHILQPETPFQPVQLEHSASRSAEILSGLVASGEVLPHPPEQLLPVATTDNGDTVYWVKWPNDRPDAWTIVTNAARNTAWPGFVGGVVEFLVAVLTGDFRVDIFPQSFPSRNPKFTQYPARSRRRDSR